MLRDTTAAASAGMRGPVIVAGATATAGLTFALPRLGQAAHFASDHTSALLASLVLALAAAALTATVAVADRRG